MKSLTYRLDSDFLERHVTLERITPEIAGDPREQGLLFLNDGQLSGDLHILDSVWKLTDEGVIRPLTVVAIHAGIRQEEYGVAGETDYQGRGESAGKYARFITEELMGHLRLNGAPFVCPSQTAFAGCSLGGLSAFDITLSHPEFFGNTGVFSGSFWWRSKSYENGYTDNDRIIFKKLAATPVGSASRYFLMAGTNDERNDRNQNGVIDAVDDTLDMYETLVTKKNVSREQVKLHIVEGGEHNTETWSRQFHHFLRFAFGNYTATN